MLYENKMLMHMFGFSNDLHDDILTCQMFTPILGIDSAVPIRMGTECAYMYMNQPDPGPRGNWWEADHSELTNSQMETIKHNIEFMQRCLDG